MDARPIGIFDSGLGGLTAVKALHALLPEENIIYFGDTGRMPYGAKTREQVRHMTEQDLAFLATFGVKAVLAACGTVSSNAPDLLTAASVPALGVLEPGVEVMGKLPGSGPVGVIATEASIRSGVFEAALRAHCPGRTVLAAPCQDFVALIEAGFGSGDAPVLEAVARYLRPMQEAGVEALLLGCTHFGIIEGAIAAFLGAGVTLVDASACAAAALARRLSESGHTGGTGELRFYTSGSREEFAALAGLFLSTKERLQVTRVPVMKG